MGVLLTGMHRSGTSAVAQWVDALGVGDGSTGDFDVNAANSNGLYEWRDVVALNDRWLGVLGGSWWAPPRVKEQTWRSLSAEQVEADRATLPAFTGAERNWFLKDPRISLLLPLWDRLLLTRTPVVVGVRAPREVAMSLHVRNGTTFRRGLALWLWHSNELLTHLHGRRTLLLDFESALAEPTSMVEGLGGFLKDVGLPASPQRFNTVLGVLEPRLRRNVAAPLDGTAEVLARDLDDVYAELRKHHLAAAPTGPLPIPDWADEAIDELGEFWSLQVERDIARTERDIARAGLARAERRLQRNPLRRVVPAEARAALRRRLGGEREGAPG